MTRLAAYAPTLEELIDVCQDGMFALIQSPGYWCAYTGWAPDDFTAMVRDATPTEAVARLWLTLNLK